MNYEIKRNHEVGYWDIVDIRTNDVVHTCLSRSLALQIAQDMQEINEWFATLDRTQSLFTSLLRKDKS